MIRGKLFRAELFDRRTYPYQTVVDVYNANKDLYPDKYLKVMNANWSGKKGQAVGNYKVGGNVLSQEWASAIGFAWSGNEKPVMGWNDMSACDNFIGTIPVLMNGVILQNEIDKQTEGVKRLCTRTWCGFDAQGEFYSEVTTLEYTLQQIVERMVGLGIMDGLVLDGSGSSQWYDGETYIKGDGRTIHSFLLLWFDKSNGDAEETEDALQIIDVGLRFTGSLTKRVKTDMLVLHHVGATGSFTVEQIHNAHINANGWLGIAYHYYVRRDGTIYRGRPENMIGGHTLNYNSISIGICAEGNFDNETMPDAQRAALKALVADVLTRYPGVDIKRHSELNATSCPGANYPFEDISGAGKFDERITDPVDYVRVFQNWLNSNYGAGLAVDGIYGKRTKAASVKAYQKLVGVTADGIFGPITRAAVSILQYGSSGTGVYILQGLLYCNGFDPNGFDGKFGGGTKSAVMAYQGLKGLEADGIAGRNTLETLMK